MNNVERVGRHIVRTFYDPPPTNDDDTPIWCLGQRYEARPAVNDHQPNNAPNTTETSTSTQRDETPTTEDDSWIRASCDETAKEQGTPRSGEDPASAKVYGGWPQPFLDDFESRIWMTYRSGFSPIRKSQDPKATSAMSFRVRLQTLNQTGFTADTGFGCMIRSGQCILANALATSKLGREWRRGNTTTSTDERRILSLFADDPMAPFSIHRFVQHGASACGKYPGEWFGPSATARCIQELANDYEEAGLRVYITGDGSDVYEDSFFKIAKTADGIFRPTLILVGTRLGIDKITPVYWDSLKASLQMPQSMGIAGGRPSASHYFVGTQGNNFFYLDPHETRKFLPLYHDPTAYTAEEVGSCHTRRLRRLDIREMDPSMLIAFLIRDQADWEEWRRGVSSVQGKAVIHVASSEPVPHQGMEREEAIDEVESFDEHDDDDSDGGLQ
ncbi:autophagy-related protein-like protein 4 [Lepidopterella palustris CBS 459.81]|uniref:Cysteine protease n=1 Tax=Lepidopterella palustris CBS 459.81 TaxID=1314670 RepID=A0A8E2DYZ9_9PEZI|nr:autophagy-related protein-like protein 4 [Lepidopterella palustris CBS 459.81]